MRAQGQSRARLSTQHPERVVDYPEYVRLRELYDRTVPSFAEVRAWPPLPAGAAS